jgi:circadian clock protein KaiC
MSTRRQADNRSELPRVSTGITGLDAITGGGLPARRTCLIAGLPGTGKTTLGNQLAFNHAAQGGRAIIATLLTETHDVIIENLQSFRFVDRELIGNQVRYISILEPLMKGGVDAVLAALRQNVRRANATLLVVDGTAIVEDIASSPFDMRRFAQQLEAQFAMLGCITILLTGAVGEELQLLGGHANGVILLTNTLVGAQHVRGLELVKLRGAQHHSGVHEFAITENGVAIFPRLESVTGYVRPSPTPSHGLGTGVPVLDTMVGGGLMPLSTTLVMGTPGAGKTILGLSFLAEGAERGEAGLHVTFHETADELASTAEGIGIDFRRYLERDLIRVLWNPPLEIGADAWAWQVLDAIDDRRPRRLFIDAITDVQRIMTAPERMSMFISALVNAIRARHVTTLISAELDEYTDERLVVPIPAASATMDNGILLRHVEMPGQLRHLVSVLKVRRAQSDPAIREMEITNHGMVISGPFSTASGLLTGRAVPHAGTIEDDAV